MTCTAVWYQLKRILMSLKNTLKRWFQGPWLLPYSAIFFKKSTFFQSFLSFYLSHTPNATSAHISERSRMWNFILLWSVPAPRSRAGQENRTVPCSSVSQLEHLPAKEKWHIREERKKQQQKQNQRKSDGTDYRFTKCTGWVLCEYQEIQETQHPQWNQFLIFNMQLFVSECNFDKYHRASQGLN